MISNVQLRIVKQRFTYESLGKPLLQYMAEMHGLSIRDFAEIFEISKGHAEAVMKHKVFPSMELGVRIARYFECTADELFAWRVDDNGDRRPLIVQLPGIKKVVRIARNHGWDANVFSGTELVKRVVKAACSEFGIRKLAAELRGQECSR